MSIQAGLVGLPNVGKSTLFNALTKSSIPAENYPFCTIDPHTAITYVPDPVLDKLQKLYGSAQQIPATVTFVDIAGLVKGAAAGQGLGNQFLGHIREVDLILHVLRCFEDPDIIREEPINPINDYEIIMAELMLKDLETVAARQEKITRSMKAVQGKPKELQELVAEQELLTRIHTALNAEDAQKVRTIIAESSVKTASLLASKKALFIANVSESEVDGSYVNNTHVQALIKQFGAEYVIPVCARIEGELAQLDDAAAREMMDLLGMRERSLDTIIRATYKHLGLITFFTCGPKEAHAWPIKKGIAVRTAAGEIHSDLERGFICAEVYNCADLFAAGSVAKVKELGKIRTEGQDYIVHDGDIILVRFNV